MSTNFFRDIDLLSVAHEYPDSQFLGWLKELDIKLAKLRWDDFLNQGDVRTIRGEIILALRDIYMIGECNPLGEDDEAVKQVLLELASACSRWLEETNTPQLPIADDFVWQDEMRIMIVNCITEAAARGGDPVTIARNAVYETLFKLSTGWVSRDIYHPGCRLAPEYICDEFETMVRQLGHGTVEAHENLPYLSQSVLSLI